MVSALVRYRCAIAVAPVTDLVSQVKFDRRDKGARSATYAYVKQQMGDPRTEKTEMQRYSPAQNAASIHVPVLLMHGEADNVVPISQSALMAKRLAKLNKPHRFVRLKGADHSFGRRSDRRRYYEEILAFLKEHLPVVEAGEVPAATH